MTRPSRTPIPLLIALLLWGMWAYAVHHHEDLISGEKHECQLCLYGAHSCAPLPAGITASITVRPLLVPDCFPDFHFTSAPIHNQQARAPPLFS
jgi:hypothetical protein